MHPPPAQRIGARRAIDVGLLPRMAMREVCEGNMRRTGRTGKQA
jgi:hypothetical protein